MIGRWIGVAGLAIGTIGLVLQFSISIPAFIANGLSLPAALVKFFSYFTILTNIAAVLVLWASLFRAGRSMLPFFARSEVRAVVAAAITVVCVTYAAVLARLWQPEGWFLVCDILLHYVTPAAFVAWWLTDGRDGSTRFGHILYWLVYPLAYLAYVMARAPLAAEAPYPFLDIERNGGAAVALACAGVFALFVAAALILVALDRALPRRG